MNGSCMHILFPFVSHVQKIKLLLVQSQLLRTYSVVECNGYSLVSVHYINPKVVLSSCSFAVKGFTDI